MRALWAHGTEQTTRLRPSCSDRHTEKLSEIGFLPRKAQEARHPYLMTTPSSPCIPTPRSEDHAECVPFANALGVVRPELTAADRCAFESSATGSPACGKALGCHIVGCLANGQLVLGKRERERERERVCAQNSSFTIQTVRATQMRSILNPINSHTQSASFVRPGSLSSLAWALSQCHSASLHPLMHLEHSCAH